jgi:hypothetical protein
MQIHSVLFLIKQNRKVNKSHETSSNVSKTSIADGF